MLFFLIGCGKDGAIGPQGEAGEKGIKGDNGNTIYSGKAAPTSAIGANGDFYLNLSNGDLYGPKSNQGWGQPFNLKGAQGEPGATILSGTTVPQNNIGKNGDFYINLKEMTIYGPKASVLGWGNPVSLKSDIENNVATYLLKPDWNKNLVETDEYIFTTSSEEYTIPGNVNSTYYVAYAAASPGYEGLDPNVSLNQWKELTGAYTDKSFVFTTVGWGMNNPMVNVKVESKLISSNTSSTKYKFLVSGKGRAIFSYNTVWVMIKSYRFKELKSENKSLEQINRYLRIR